MEWPIATEPMQSYLALFTAAFADILALFVAFLISFAPLFTFVLLFLRLFCGGITAPQGIAFCSSHRKDAPFAELCSRSCNSKLYLLGSCMASKSREVVLSVLLSLCRRDPCPHLCPCPEIEHILQFLRWLDYSRHPVLPPWIRTHPNQQLHQRYRSNQWCLHLNQPPQTPQPVLEPAQGQAVSGIVAADNIIVKENCWSCHPLHHNTLSLPRSHPYPFHHSNPPFNPHILHSLKLGVLDHLPCLKIYSCSNI